MPSEILYFAYGSNLDANQMLKRIGSNPVAKRAKLTDYKLCFNKLAADGSRYANIIEDGTGVVWGVVYSCTPHAIENLDRDEGVPGGHYRRILIVAELESGEKVNCQTYVAGDKYTCKDGKPRNDYLNRILLGARYHNLPIDYIESIAACCATRSTGQ